MQYKFFIIDNLECLEVWKDGQCINTITQPFCENVLKLVNYNGILSRNTLGLYVRNIFLYWAGEQELDDQALFTTIPSLRVAIENRQGEPIEVLYPEHFSDIVFYVILKARQRIAYKKLWVIRCKRCHRIFANFKHGRNVVYCDYKDSFGKSCREIVAERVDGWMKSDYDRKIQKIFVKYYNEQQRKRKRKQVTTEQVAIWSKKARAIRDQCQKGEITEEDFIKWLDENKENYNGQIT
ncbi:MAG: hypothetical protein IJ598_00915 [Ruminococcus sp.]|nr:hypothetical protein [Ruminococcus sp.]